MAAYAALLSLTQTLEKMLNADEHRCPIFNQTEQEKLSSLHGKLNFLLSFLEEDFVEKNSEALRCFEGRIRDATCDAEDVIESHVRLESASCEDRIETHVSNQVLLKFKQKYGGLEKIIEEIGTISTEVEKIKERNHIEDFPRSNQLPAVSSKFGSNKECVMVGFEEELLEIKDRLTGSPSKLKIISIVGMGGIGKTTLAKNAFEDPLTIYHFHIRAWITASQKYHVPEILEGLLHCGIHDLMRDLCLRKAHEEKFLQVVDRLLKTSPECINNQRRVCLVSGFNDRLADFYASPVRSLLHFNSKFVRSQYSLFTLPLLKVLHAIELWLSEFPIELVNLKYIALINIEINKLPHPSAAQMEKKFIPLGNLQTLARVRNFKLTKEVLQMMPNLKKLAIKFSCESHTQLSSYFIDNIIHFHQLEYLKLFFMDKYDLRYHDPLPENLYLGTRLTRLTVCRCGLSSKNMAVLGSLPNLQVLKLKQTVFDSNLWEPREGEFRKLKFLLLWWANLKHWKADETHFPNLQRLSLEYCFELVEIPSGIGDIPTLQEIRLFRCPSARSSAQSIQKEQENQGNYDLQIIYDCDEELKYEV